MNVGLLAKGSSSLNVDLFSVVQENVNDGCCNTCKAQTIRDCKTGGKEQWAICFVLFDVECEVFWVQDSGDVVRVTGIIKGAS